MTTTLRQKLDAHKELRAQEAKEREEREAREERERLVRIENKMRRYIGDELWNELGFVLAYRDIAQIDGAVAHIGEWEISVRDGIDNLIVEIDHDNRHVTSRTLSHTRSSEFPGVILDALLMAEQITGQTIIAEGGNA